MSEAEAQRPISDFVNSDNRNSQAIACVRCGCKILQANVGQLHNNETFELPVDTKTTKEYSSFWKLTDIFDFHNVGFSRPALGQPNIKYLTCADCEQGVLGLQTTPKNIYLCHDTIKYI